MNLNNVHLIMAHESEASYTRQTRKLVADLEKQGLTKEHQTHVVGVNGLSLARNISISHALRDASASTQAFLMLDDDIEAEVFEIEELMTSLQAGLRLGQWSAVAHTYVVNGELAMARASERLWLTGLGCLMVDAEHLRALAKRLPDFGPTLGLNLPVYEFASERVIGNVFHQEDYYFTRLLGGVRVIGAVGHVKPHPLRPSGASLVELLGRDPSGPFLGCVK